MFNKSFKLTEVLLLLFSFESFEELLYEVSSGDIDEDELFILVESFILELSYNFISSPFLSSLSSSVFLLLINNLSSSSMELFSSSDSE
jgi:hypothetical protein